MCAVVCFLVIATLACSSVWAAAAKEAKSQEQIGEHAHNSNQQ
jgi:uncharacterized protein YdbL (DUF1318 family)